MIFVFSSTNCLIRDNFQPSADWRADHEVLSTFIGNEQDDFKREEKKTVWKQLVTTAGTVSISCIALAMLPSNAVLSYLLLGTITGSIGVAYA